MLSDDDIELMARSGASISFNSISNMKLSSGGPLRFDTLRGAGTNVTIGTDGSASNNSLDMFQAMKVSALTVKDRYGAGFNYAFYRDAESGLTIYVAGEYRHTEYRVPSGQADVAADSNEEVFGRLGLSF